MNKFKLSYGAKLLLSIFLGGTLSLIFLGHRYFDRQTDFADAATLGAQTTSFFAKKDGYPIHCQPDAEIKGCVQGVFVRKSSQQVIWLGNSQLHAINHFRPGELNAPAILANALAPLGVDVVTVSQPNANLQEQYIIFEYLRSKFPIQQLLLPVVFDDFREDGLRDDVRTLLQDSEFVRSPRIQAQDLKTIAKTDAGNKVEDIQSTPQSYVEGELDHFLERNWPLWHARPQMRGDLFIGLYRLRNRVFGITPSTKRKIIPSHYERNWQALEALVKSAVAAKIGVVLYVAPIGGTAADRPYVDSEYKEFKDALKALAKNNLIDFINFEDIVSPELWGDKGSTSGEKGVEVDFMHFTGAGHQVLAEALYQRLLSDGSPVRGDQR
jgi:hypothetical protein